MFDIHSKASFEKSIDKIEFVFRFKNGNHFPIVLIGNKCDLEESREITSSKGMELANKYGIPFFETSAKVGINVEESIFSLIEEIYKKKEFVLKVNSNQKDCLLM
jgi:GTPase KRas